MLCLQSSITFIKFNYTLVIASVLSWFLSRFSHIGSSHHRFNVPHRIAASLDEVKSNFQLAVAIKLNYFRILLRPGCGSPIEQQQ